jgi:hypothetical protein
MAAWKVWVQQFAALVAADAGGIGACEGEEVARAPVSRAGGGGGASTVRPGQEQLSRLAEHMVQWLVQHDYDLSLVTERLREVSQLRKLQPMVDAAVVDVMKRVVCGVQTHVQTKFGFKLRCQYD